MRKTLFRQLIMYMMLFIAGACAVGYIVIEFYFDDYYYAQQKTALKTGVDAVAAQYDTADSETLDALIDAYYASGGIVVHTYTPQSQQGYGGQHGAGWHNMGDMITRENVGRFFVSTAGQGSGQGTEWLSYIAETPEGNLILGRMSYENMDAVVEEVQRFFLYFGMVIAALFIVFSYVFSRSISRPLHALNAIAGEMGRLNFSMRYQGRRRDEIGQLGQTLNLLTGKLENTITQLTSELSKGKTLEKMRTQFTAQVSHELQTPLAVIKGYAEALCDHMYEGAEADRAYRILLGETQKISNLVTDLLDLSQMEAGAYVVRKRQFNIRAMLQKMCEDYGALPKDKPLRITFDTNVDDTLIYFGDPLRIEQAVRNILTNAIKHVSDGGRIAVTLAAEAGHLTITVDNDGKNIAEGDLPHIFDSYYQGKKEGRGTGLGLAIARHIIGLHDGGIAASNTTTGVRFIITLPL
jgi:signal transduction histidine kinase